MPPGVPTIAGVFTDPQFNALRGIIEKNSKHSLTKLDSKQVLSSGNVLLKGGDYETDLTPVVGPDGFTIDLDFAPTSVVPGNPALASRVSYTSVTIWDGQWVALSFAPGPGNRPAQTFFIKVKGQKS